MWLLAIFIPGLMFRFLISREDRRKVETNIKAAEKAKTFEVPPIHGTRKLASDKQLRRAGIL